jgi:hypothetical protein
LLQKYSTRQGVGSVVSSCQGRLGPRLQLTLRLQLQLFASDPKVLVLADTETLKAVADETEALEAAEAETEAAPARGEIPD